MSDKQDDEVQLPNGWSWVSINETGEYINGFAFKPSHRELTGLPIVRIQNLTDETKPLNTTTLDVHLDYKIDNGDMLVSWSATLDVFMWRRGPALVNQHIFKVIPQERVILKDLLFYWLKRAIQELQETEHLHGSTMMHINRGPFIAHLVPLPPLAEQTRIVAKLEELLSDLDAGVAELKAAQKKLTQYRQSLLKAAVEGALTAEWRATHVAPLPPRGGGVGGEGALPTNPHHAQKGIMLARARDLRRNQTPDEQRLWQQLRAHRLDGFKFCRQQQIGHYIVDFVCFEKRLIIELDGGGHSQQTDYDAKRDAWLSSQGFRVMRFWNNEWAKESESVLNAIWLALNEEASPLPNPSPTGGEGLENETGAELLKRILIERRARWEAKQLAKFKEQGKPPPKDWQKKYPEPVQPDTTDLPELPEGWVWASLDALIGEGPQNGLYLPASRYGKGTPILRIDDYQIGWHRPRAVLNLVDADEKMIEVYSLKMGDIVINRVNSMTHLGKSLRIGETMDSVLFESNMMRLRISESVNADYVSFYLGSNLGRARLISDAKWAVNQASINQQDIKKTPIPIPSQAEQTHIAAVLSCQHKAMERQTVAIEVSLKQSSAQRQNILRAAFSGQLVPQDPNDEPASVLLERIRAERAERDAVKKPRGRKAKEFI